MEALGREGRPLSWPAPFASCLRALMTLGRAGRGVAGNACNCMAGGGVAWRGPIFRLRRLTPFRFDLRRRVFPFLARGGGGGLGSVVIMREPSLVETARRL